MLEYIGNEYTYLLPGELIVTGENLKICTVLGSCVSVCLFDPLHKIAGMNHFLLPLYNLQDPNQFRYGNASLEYMLNQMIIMGAVSKEIKASVFGGSSMFRDSEFSYNIGRKNLEVANQFLKEEALGIICSETEGNLGRKVVFDTNTGIINCYLALGRDPVKTRSNFCSITSFQP